MHLNIDVSDAAIEFLRKSGGSKNVIQFLILAFVVFLFMKVINKLKKPAPAAAPTTKVCPYCKSEIHIDAVKCPHCASALDKPEP